MTPSEYYAQNTGVYLAKQILLVALDKACRLLKPERKKATILGSEVWHERKDGKDYLNGLPIKDYACRPTKEQFHRAMMHRKNAGGANWLSFGYTIEGEQKCTFSELHWAYERHHSFGR